MVGCTPVNALQRVMAQAFILVTVSQERFLQLFFCGREQKPAYSDTKSTRVCSVLNVGDNSFGNVVDPV